MHDIFDYMAQHKHERLCMTADPVSGLQAVIALHNTMLGPALGGVRLWQYEREEAAIRDALRLSEAMTYKAAVADLPLGGGKAVILADGKEQEPGLRTARFRAFGRFVESLGGRYITAPDVGTTSADMATIKGVTSHVAGYPVELGGSGDLAPMAAFGVLQGMRALAEEVLGVRRLLSVRVAIQGLGSVGMNLAKLLVAEGAVVIGTDIRPEVVRQARMQLYIETVAPEAIYEVPATIFAPCALGGVLNDRTIERLYCKIVAGAANNQLEDNRHAELLQQRGIVYGVDYVLNAGGLINVAQELEGYDYQKARQKVTHIYETVKRMLAISQAEHISTLSAARQMVASVLQRPHTTVALAKR
jgi:leucine dehydrogenase